MTKHIGMLNLGNSFFNAATIIKESTLYWPTYYLYCHAIELALKSFLHFKGMDEKGLRNIGHNLIKAWNECSSYGIKELVDNHQILQECISIMSSQYMGKGFEYGDKGYKSLPDLDQLHEALQNILISLDTYFRSNISVSNRHSEQHPTTKH
jgi:hypothetical protein